ncbi:MAG: VanZ family protein [Candidatus Aminicenantales bacterium]
MKKKRVFVAWSLVILCAASILAIVPLARSIQRLVTGSLGRSAFGYFVLVGISCFLAGMVWLLFFRLKIRQFSNYLVLALVGAAYVYFTLKLWKHPEEAVHFLEYGLLSFLLYRALRNHYSDITIYFSSLFIGTFVGIIDEILQWITPNRSWDLRDVGLNALAVLLFQIALALGIRPRGIANRPSSPSLSFASICLSINLIMLGLCFSNTPSRVAAYTHLFPSLSFLQKEEIMHDFGLKRHSLPGIGVFYSRLSLEEIKVTDRSRAEEFAAILNAWKDKPYEEFLRLYSSQTEPFLHEFRVRIFRRDQKINEAKMLPSGSKRAAAMLVAYRENLFLETYFGHTLRASGYAWPASRQEEIRLEVDSEATYRSPVGASFSPFRNEAALWTGIGILLAITLLTNLTYRRWLSRQRPK